MQVTKTMAIPKPASATMNSSLRMSNLKADMDAFYKGAPHLKASLDALHKDPLKFYEGTIEFMSIVDKASCDCEKMKPKEREDYFTKNKIGEKVNAYAERHSDVVFAAQGATKEEAGSIMQMGDPLLIGNILLIHNKDMFNAVTRPEFRDYLNSQDPAITSAHVYTIRTTENSAALLDSKLRSAYMLDFYDHIGAGGTSNFFRSVGTTGNVDALTDKALIQNRHVREMSKDATFASELSYLIATKPDKAGAVLGSMERLNALGVKEASRLLAEAWVTGKVDGLASPEAVGRIGSGRASIWTGVARYSDGAGTAPRVMLARFGEDMHNRAALLIAQSLVAKGYEVVYLENLQNSRDAANAAMSYRVSAVGVSMAFGDSQIAADMMSYLRAAGHGNIRFFGGGAVMPSDSKSLQLMGMKILSQVGDVVPFLSLYMMRAPQPLALMSAKGGLQSQALYGRMPGGMGPSAAASMGMNVAYARVAQGFVPNVSHGSGEERKKKKRLAGIPEVNGRASKRATEAESAAIIAKALAKNAQTAGNPAAVARATGEAAISIRTTVAVNLIQSAVFNSRDAGQGIRMPAAGKPVLLIQYSRLTPANPTRSSPRARKATRGISVSADSRARIAILAVQAHYVKESGGILQATVPTQRISSQSRTAAYAKVMVPLDIKTTPFKYSGLLASMKSDTMRIRGAGGGAPAPLNPQIGQPAARLPKPAEGPRTPREKRLNLSPLISMFMGIIGTFTERFRHFSAARRERNLERLLVRSRDFGARLEGEAKRFGIDLGGLKTGSYYDVLGISYTEDPKEIRDAYVELVKKYHPDVSREIDAAEMTKRINEVYAVLKDEKLKSEYDASSRKGKSGLSADMAKGISQELVRRYMEARERDFREFEKTVSVPLQADALGAAVEGVCDWNGRLNKVTDATFRNFRAYGKRVRKLGSVNRRLLQKEAGEVTLSRLRENGRRLDELLIAYDEVSGGISIVTDNVRKEIGAQESVIAKKLRAAV
jgi:methylmalonyl-CoA mutase cobalamin-binding domain/chain